MSIELDPITVFVVETLRKLGYFTSTHKYQPREGSLSRILVSHHSWTPTICAIVVDPGMILFFNNFNTVHYNNTRRPLLLQDDRIGQYVSEERFNIADPGFDLEAILAHKFPAKKQNDPS